MPNYRFACNNCNHTYEKFFSFTEWGKFPTKSLKCPVCKKRKVNKTIDAVPFAIHGWSPGNEIKRENHLRKAEEAMDEARTKGVSKTEIEEGYGLMADREKAKGLAPGTLSGKKDFKYDTKSDGTKCLTKESKIAMKKRLETQKVMRKGSKIGRKRK